jgi:hypothetical protein
VEWLTRLWEKLLRDVVLTVGGLVVVGTQIAARHPNIGLIGAGLALTAPSAYANLQKTGSGSHGSSSPPPGPAPPPPPYPGDDE